MTNPKDVQNMDAFSGIDFTNFFDNMAPNDYMLPPINPGVTSATSCDGKLNNWDWSAFNSGMASVADMDMNMEGSQTPYHIKNITNVINTMASNNSKNCAPQLQQALNSRNPMGQIKNAFGNNALQNNSYSSDMTHIESLLNTLMNGVCKLNNYESDANRAYMCVTYAINYLNNSCENDALKSAYLIYLLSKKEACRFVLYGCNNLADTIVNSLMKYRSNQNIVRHCVGCIYYLVENEKFVKQYRNNPHAIKVLCNAVQTNIDAIAFYAVATIHTLLVKFPDTRQEVISTNIFEKLAKFVKMDNPKFVTVVIDVLHFLTTENERVQLLLPSTGVLTDLIRIIQTNQFEKLLFTICRFIKSLSFNDNLKPFFIKAGIMNVLTKLLLNNSRRLACSALWSLRNFSDVACSEQNLDELILICLRFIVSQTSDDQSRLKLYTIDYDMSYLCTKKIGEPKLVSCAIGILTNVTCNNFNNKELLISSNGINILLTLCCNGYPYREIIEPALCCLKHVTSQNKYAEQSGILFKSLNGFAVLSSLLNIWYQPDDFFPQLKRAALGIISNIVVSNRNYIADFYRLKILAKSMQIVIRSLDIIKKMKDCNTQNNGGIECKKEFNAYEKLIEDSIVLVFIIVGTCTNKNDVLNNVPQTLKTEILLSLFTMEFIDTLGNLLFTTSSNVLSCAIGILSSFSKIPEGMTVIKNVFFRNGIEITNHSVSSIILNQLKNISSDNCIDQEIRNAATSLLMNWSCNVSRCSNNSYHSNSKLTQNNCIDQNSTLNLMGNNNVNAMMSSTFNNFAYSSNSNFNNPSVKNSTQAPENILQSQFNNQNMSTSSININNKNNHNNASHFPNLTEAFNQDSYSRHNMK